MRSLLIKEVIFIHYLRYQSKKEIYVGKFKNSISIIYNEGNPIIKKGLSIENDYYGFAKLEEQVDLIINNYGFTYDDCIAGVESVAYPKGSPYITELLV